MISSSLVRTRRRRKPWAARWLGTAWLSRGPLLTIHGQNDQLRLLAPDQQLAALDRFDPAIAPLLSSLTRSLVPGVVVLLVGGMLVGPNGFGLAVESGGVAMLAELGLGMLFLLAGFELEVSSVTGRGGRRAAGTWAPARTRTAPTGR